MRIVSISEDINIERRISITPEIAKKYISNGFDVSLSKNYGNHLGIRDEDYSKLGVKILENEKIKSSIDDHFSAFSEPFSDYSSIPTFLLCREASKNFKVLLSGLTEFSTILFLTTDFSIEENSFLIFDITANNLNLYSLFSK